MKHLFEQKSTVSYAAGCSGCSTMCGDSCARACSYGCSGTCRGHCSMTCADRCQAGPGML